MDKQIEKEEMARIIAFELCPNRAIHKKWGEEAQCYSDNNFAECKEIKNVVDKLYNAGYRKIPENAVVIEKTEYDKLVSLADECLDWRRKNCNVAELPKENAVVLDEAEYSDLLSDEIDTIERDIAEYWATQDVKSVAKELHKDGYRKLDDHAIFVLRKAKGLEEKTREETAEKFAERVKMAFYYHFDELIPSIMAKDIDEICKELTEGKE